jgi:hypothetical protein
VRGRRSGAAAQGTQSAALGGPLDRSVGHRRKLERTCVVHSEAATFRPKSEPKRQSAFATGCRPQSLETLAHRHGATRGAVLRARRMHFDPQLGPVAAFVIRFNLDLLPATTAPVMYNVELTGAARLYRAASSDRRERG